MRRLKKHKKPPESHSRIYIWEQKLPAWEYLTTDSKALLVAIRALFKPSQFDIVYLSVREAARRMYPTCSTKRATKALKQLEELGWISCIQKGSFHVKTRFASVWRLNNEDGPNGQPASRAYASWQPSLKNNGSHFNIDQ